MNRKRIKEKELKKLEARALRLYGSTKYNVIEKNHRRIIWLRKYLGYFNE